MQGNDKENIKRRCGAAFNNLLREIIGVVGFTRCGRKNAVVRVLLFVGNVKSQIVQVLKDCADFAGCENGAWRVAGGQSLPKLWNRKGNLYSFVGQYEYDLYYSLCSNAGCTVGRYVAQCKSR